MKYLLLVVFGLMITLRGQSQNEYVCPPCNHDCDKSTFDKPGSCPSCSMTLVRKSSLNAFKNLSADEFCDRISANPNAIILDVRSEGEFNGRRLRNTYGHFKNAININITELKERLNELEQYKGRELLVYCSHSVRSPQACILLTENGFTNVANMKGGVSTLGSKLSPCLVKSFILH